MKVVDFIMFCYCDLDACRVRLPPFSARIVDDLCEAGYRGLMFSTPRLCDISEDPFAVLLADDRSLLTSLRETAAFVRSSRWSPL